MSNSSSPHQYQHDQLFSGSIAGDNSGDGTWGEQMNYNQHQQYHPSSPSMSVLPMDSSLNYGEGLTKDNFFPDSTHMDTYTAVPFGDTFDSILSPLPEFDDTTQALLNFDDAPEINVNRTNAIPTTHMQDWSSRTYLYPLQTDVQMQSSPALSNTSQLSDSSIGLMSPRTINDPITPSPTSQGINYPTILSSPDSPLRPLNRLSSTLGHSFNQMKTHDQSPDTCDKSNNINLMYASSGPSSSTSEHFPLVPMGWMPQTYTQQERSSSSSGTHRPQSHSLSAPNSASAPPTPTAPPGQIHNNLTYTHAQQYQSWKDVPSTCPIAQGRLRQFIPQRMYKPHTGSDRRRYVEQVPLSPPIIFEVQDPSEWGIDLEDAIKCRTKRLIDRDALMFESCGPSVSIRLEWPGVPWSRQIPTKDFRNPPGPITKAKLAKNIAKCVQRFIKDNAGKPINDEEDTNALRYRVGYGPNDVKLEDLILVSLHHVSQGSWQPQLRTKRQIS